MGESVNGINSGLERLAKLFEEDSENDATFYGFSDTELIDTSLDYDHEIQPNTSSSEQEATSEPPSAVKAFRLRIALKQHKDAEEEEKMINRGLKRQREVNATKKERHVKSEDEEHRSDSDEDISDNFLTKREQNIKANKAMLAQLMADLQKMPGGAGLLEKTSKQKTKVKHGRPPRSGLSGGESRRNPERASRRQTRSMRGSGQDPSPPDEADVKLSLEEELLEVHRAPRHRSTPRPKQTKPHIIRPVEDVTEDDLQLVADNMTDKVYNSFSGSTCHQCRQKTVDTKTCCRSEDCRGIQGQFCGPCLRNRYGEDVRKALMDPNWKCPPCRGICNCSFCRQREGRCPTGILFPLAQYHGFSDVHSYLSSLRNKLKEEEK